MVEDHALFEWSTEVALNLGMKYCDWVLAEDVNEDYDSEEEAQKPSSGQFKSESIIMNLRKSICMARPTEKSSLEDFNKYYVDAEI